MRDERSKVGKENSKSRKPIFCNRALIFLFIAFGVDWKKFPPSENKAQLRPAIADSVHYLLLSWDANPMSPVKRVD
jgi:hypothetical protein